MKVTPLADRVLVKRVDSDTKTKGGLYIPDSAKEKPAEGLVLAVGAGTALDDGSRTEMAVKEGDRVLFGKYSGTEITVEGVEHLILREDDILGIVVEE